MILVDDLVHLANDKQYIRARLSSTSNAKQYHHTVVACLFVSFIAAFNTMPSHMQLQWRLIIVGLGLVCRLDR